MKTSRKTEREGNPFCIGDEIWNMSPKSRRHISQNEQSLHQIERSSSVRDSLWVGRIIYKYLSDKRLSSTNIRELNSTENKYLP